MKDALFSCDTRRAARQTITRSMMALVLLAAGCSIFYPKSAPAPGPLSASDVASARARWPETTEQSLVTGRELFVARCNRCHDHPDVRAVSEPDWPDIVERMGEKADLDAAQKRSVLLFVLAARAAHARAGSYEWHRPASHRRNRHRMSVIGHDLGNPDGWLVTPVESHLSARVQAVVHF